MNNTNINPNKEFKSPISPDIKPKAPDLSTGRGPQEPVLKTKEPTPPAKPKEPTKAPLPPKPPQPALEKKPPLPKKKINIKQIITIASIAFVLLAAIITAAYFYLSYLRTIPLTITSNQKSVNLKIDEKEYKNISIPYTVKLKAGKYEITVSKEGFFPLAKTVELDLLTGSQELVFDLQEKQPITKIFDKEIFYPVYDKETSSFLYFAKEEKGYTLNEYNLEKREETVLTDGIIANIEKVVWSPTHKQLIVKIINSSEPKENFIPFIEEYGEGIRVNWLLNLERKDLVKITKKHFHPSIKNIYFSPEGDKIVYFFNNNVIRTLAVANSDGSNFKNIVQLKNLAFEPDIVWSPDGERVAIFISAGEQKESPEKASDIYIYSFAERNVSRITDDGVSYGALFSPEGEKLLYESSNNIWLYDFARQEEEAAVNLEIASALEKCVWMNNETMAVLDTDNNLWAVKTSGEKNLFNYKKTTMPEEVKRVLADENKLFLISARGIYELEITEENI